MKFKPMLAATLERLEDITRYPVIVSPKLDGIRCLIQSRKAVSRKLLPIPNRHIRKVLAELPDGFDGELMVPGSFDNVQSAIMSEDGEPKFEYHVFDIFSDLPFEARIQCFPLSLPDYVKVVPQRQVDSLEELRMVEQTCVAHGLEGIMGRKPEGPYKQGRATLREGYLWKHKRWHDDEGVIVGALELLGNENEAEEDELGRTKRSTAAGGLIPRGMLGAVWLDWRGKRIKVGSGFTDEQRKLYWAMNRADTLAGLRLTFKYQEVTKSGAPRFPIAKAVRLMD